MALVTFFRAGDGSVKTPAKKEDILVGALFLEARGDDSRGGWKSEGSNQTWYTTIASLADRNDPRDVHTMLEIGFECLKPFRTALLEFPSQILQSWQPACREMQDIDVDVMPSAIQKLFSPKKGSPLKMPPPNLGEVRKPGKLDITFYANERGASNETDVTPSDEDLSASKHSADESASSRRRVYINYPTIN